MDLRACKLSHGCGTVFKITPEGALTTLHRFAGTDGDAPNGALVQGPDGFFYGTTANEGANGAGTIFKISMRGSFKTLYDFCSQPNCNDGTGPNGLALGNDGNYNGTTIGGGANGNGVIFKATPTGAITILHTFSASEGKEVRSPLYLASDGNFYGVATLGGINASGCSSEGCGTAFSITPGGAFTLLHQFQYTDGSQPSGMIQGTDGTFYGAAEFGGSNSCANGCGLMFNLANGLNPFVNTIPAAGRVGQFVGIIGANLTGATSVTFNGTAATFTVVSSTLIKATIPAGATTGIIQAVTPANTVSTNLPFIVLR